MRTLWFLEQKPQNKALGPQSSPRLQAPAKPSQPSAQPTGEIWDRSQAGSGSQTPSPLTGEVLFTPTVLQTKRCPRAPEKSWSVRIQVISFGSRVGRPAGWAAGPDWKVLSTDSLLPPPMETLSTASWRLANRQHSVHRESAAAGLRQPAGPACKNKVAYPSCEP